jgi:glycosyltransferase involved in cell wall biosynthesis
MLVGSGTTTKILNVQPSNHSNVAFHLIARAVFLVLAPLRLIWERTRGSDTLLIALLAGRSRIVDAAYVSLARFLGLRINLYYHSSEFANSRSSIMAFMLKVAGPKAKHIMSCKNMSRDFAKTYNMDENFIIVDNSAYVPTPEFKRNPVTHPIRLGLLSNLTRAKGVDDAIQTLRKLIELGSDCELVLAGPVVDSDTEELIIRSKEEFPGRIDVIGPVSGPSKDAFFKSIDIFLFPSTHKHETQSLVVPEAQSYGCPVIVYDHRYVPDNIPNALSYCVVPMDKTFDEVAAKLILQWIAEPKNFSEAQKITLNHFETKRETAIRAVKLLGRSLRNNTGSNEI